jgi:hypothetical protein
MSETRSTTASFAVPTAPPPPPPAFARAWKWLLALGIATMAVAALFGIFDTSAASAWIFVVGAVLGIVGVASLAVHLYHFGRRQVRALEQRLENELDGRGNGRP